MIHLAIFKVKAKFSILRDLKTGLGFVFAQYKFQNSYSSYLQEKRLYMR